MKKTLLLAAMVAATTAVSAQQNVQKHERPQPTAAQQARAKKAMKKAQKTLLLPQKALSYEWDYTAEDWYADPDLEFQLVYDEQGRLVQRIELERNEEGNVVYRYRTTNEYDENGNILSTLYDSAEGAEGDEWDAHRKDVYTYDEYVKDFQTSYKRLSWDGEGWTEDIPGAPLPIKAPAHKKMLASKSYPSYWEITRDEQGRVLKTAFFALDYDKLSEENPYTNIGGMEVTYDEATGLPASINYAPVSSFGGDLKAPAKKGYKKVAGAPVVPEGAYPYTLTVEEWEDFDGTQLLCYDPVDLLEGACRLKKATLKSLTFGWTADIDAVYDEQGGYTQTWAYDDGFVSRRSLTYTDENGSYEEAEEYIDEADVEDGNYYDDKDLTEVIFDDRGINTFVNYYHTDNSYNSGNPVLYKSWNDFNMPTYDEGAMTELVRGWTDFNYDSETESWIPTTYYDSKEVYSDFMELVVDKIARVDDSQPTTTAAKYNLAGQRVNDSYKGVVIQNGKKFVQK